MAEAASDETARGLQLANLLRVDEVPAKLRCGMCNKLAVDAVKLLCCSTSICEPCSHDIPETCTVCTHSPTSPDDCMPDKKLRTTVRAFVRTEEKKRSKNAEPMAATPVQAPTPVQAAADTPVISTESEQKWDIGGITEAGEKETTQIGELVEATAGALDVQPHHDGETEMQTTAAGADQEQEEEEEDDDDAVVITVDRPEGEEEQFADEQNHNKDYSAGDYAEQQYGGQTNGQNTNSYDQDQQGFGNMNNFNPMMGMQNGMGMGSFSIGMPNMMGMAGMGGMAGMNFDPSMMFSNGGFGGVDMNAMMNMGMGGMNGMGGFGGMMNGSGGGFYGSGNSGGYNSHHQQFGNQVNAPFQNQRGYYNRGRGGFGRGRGGFYPRGGRGGFNSYNQFSGGHNQNYSQHLYNQGFQNGDNMQHPSDEERGPQNYNSTDAAGGTSNDAARPEHNGEGDDTNEANLVATNMAGDQQQGGDASGVDATAGVDATDSMDVDGMTNDAGAVPSGASFTQQGQGYARGGSSFQGGAYGNVTTIGGESDPPPAPPVNAPKGPKAMRQGLPNSGRYSRPQQPSMQPPAVPGLHAEHSQSYESTSRRGRSRTRSRSLSRHETRKDRERTPMEARESDEAHAERKERERERRKRKEREARDARDEGDANGDERSDKAKSRPDSLDDHERRKHRDKHDERCSSRRDRSREKRKRDDHSRSPGKSHSTHDESSDRSRRKSKNDRGRNDMDDSDRAKDRRGSRKHSRRKEDDYEYDGKDRNKHGRSSRDDGKARDRDRDRDRRQATPEPVEDLGISIKGAARNKKSSIDRPMGPPSAPRSSRDDRRSSMPGSDSAPATPATAMEDRYAADREKAMADRLAKHNKSLGKRTSRAEEEISPREDRAQRFKRQRQDTRRHSARFE